MTGLLCALILLGWLAGIVVLTVVAAVLLSDEPLLRLAAQMMPVALALYLAVVIVLWPAAVIARAADSLMNRNRP
ncbi:hypothetical protein AB0D11_06580 [Streptomyces monashensis]|uniref:hypothetical protein n=1 Tax=Streptomyces monashensis TaxID=1678012 RepID=UPI0033EA7D53